MDADKPGECKERRRQLLLMWGVVFLYPPQSSWDNPVHYLLPTTSRHTPLQPWPRMPQHVFLPPFVGLALGLLLFLLCYSVLTLLMCPWPSRLSRRQLEGWQDAAVRGTKATRAAGRDLAGVPCVACRHSHISGAADHGCHEPDTWAHPQTAVLSSLRQGTTRYTGFGTRSAFTPRPAYPISSSRSPNLLPDEKHLLTGSRKAQAQRNTTLSACESCLLHHRPSLLAVSPHGKWTPHCPAVSGFPALEHIRAIVSITSEAGRPWLWFTHIFVMKCSWQVHSAFILAAILHLVYFTCQLKCKQSVYILYITAHCHHVCLWSMGVSWIQSRKPWRAPWLSWLTRYMIQMEEMQLVGPVHCATRRGAVPGTVHTSSLHATAYAGKHVAITCLRSLSSWHRADVIYTANPSPQRTTNGVSSGKELNHRWW